jgi:hypothetical protein
MAYTYCPLCRIPASAFEDECEHCGAQLPPRPRRLFASTDTARLTSSVLNVRRDRKIGARARKSA